MSVRDTGWRDGERHVGDFILTAHPTGWAYISLDHGDDTRTTLLTLHSMEPKRAAEDALRQLCRDTLTALGD